MKTERMIGNGKNQPDARQQDAVYSSELHVDFEAEVGYGLRRRLVDVFRLHALSCKSEQNVSDSLYFGCRSIDVKQSLEPFDFMSTTENMFSNRIRESFPAERPQSVASLGRYS